jgi:hypothetical protein
MASPETESFLRPSCLPNLEANVVVTTLEILEKKISFHERTNEFRA